MSGGGGGGGPIGPTPPGPMDCDSLVFKTVLNSPKAAVIAKLKPKDWLDLDLQDEEGPVVAITEAAEIAGSITAPHLTDLIRCMNAGHEYVAQVLSVNGGRCEVQVRPKAK
jgi:hypothetical protein